MARYVRERRDTISLRGTPLLPRQFSNESLALATSVEFDLRPWAVFIMGYQASQLRTWLRRNPIFNYQEAREAEDIPLLMDEVGTAAIVLCRPRATRVPPPFRQALDRISAARRRLKSGRDPRQSDLRLKPDLESVATCCQGMVAHFRSLRHWYGFGETLAGYVYPRIHDPEEISVRPLFRAAAKLADLNQFDFDGSGCTDDGVLNGIHSTRQDLQRFGSSSLKALSDAELLEEFYRHTPEKWKSDIDAECLRRTSEDLAKRVVAMLQRLRNSKAGCSKTPARIRSTAGSISNPSAESNTDLELSGPRAAHTQPKPHWNRELGELHYEGELIRTVRSNGDHLIKILDAFQKKKWSRSVKNPEVSKIPDGELGTKEKRTCQTECIRSLNKGLRRIRFHSHRGYCIRWRLLPPNSTAPARVQESD